MEGSDGLALEGLHHDEADLPAFVHSRSRDQLRLHATISKLETPVLYFYPSGSQPASQVSVRVDFPEGIDELKEAGLTAVPSSVVKPPRIAESPVNMECKLIEELRFGDSGKRSIVLGEVLRFHIHDQVLTTGGRVDLDAMKPVGRLAGSGYIRLSDRFDMKRMSHADWRARKRNGEGS